MNAKMCVVILDFREKINKQTDKQTKKEESLIPQNSINEKKSQNRKKSIKQDEPEINDNE